MGCPTLKASWAAKVLHKHREELWELRDMTEKRPLAEPPVYSQILIWFQRILVHNVQCIPSQQPGNPALRTILPKDQRLSMLHDALGAGSFVPPPTAPTFLLRDGTKFSCKTQMSYASFQTRRGRSFPLHSSFRHSVKTSLAKWGSACHHFSKFTFPQGRHEEEQGGEPSHQCPRVTVTQDNTLKNLEGEGMWEGWRGGCLLTYKNISKGFASCEKKKGAQGNVVQAIGGKKNLEIRQSYCWCKEKEKGFFSHSR